MIGIEIIDRPRNVYLKDAQGHQTWKRGPEITVDEDGWKHYAYLVRLVNNETGATMDVPYRAGVAHTNDPTAADVLYCVLSDASGYENAQDVDDYAAEYGIETPTQALKLWRQVEKQSRDLRQLLGAEYHGAVFPTGDDDTETIAARLAA